MRQDRRMTCPTAVPDPAHFLARYWQQRPLLLRDAWPADALALDPDTLAGLACEEDVESRLIEGSVEQQRWSLEHGPFDEARFEALPERCWTLLVQAVDQWLPDVARLLEGFSFLPRWRLDDVMVSIAADGGGVGPHFDYYDVFLLQAAGQRRWEIGAPCGPASALEAGAPLRLLREFEATETHLLGPGDMLYLPAGVSHWGTAVGDGCITCSVGFRAPSEGELLMHAAPRLSESLGEDRRYRDPEAVAEHDPYCLDASLASLANPVDALDREALRDALATAFGQLVTEPRYRPLEDEEVAPDALPLRGWLAPAQAISSRLAWRSLASPNGAKAELFVNGDSYLTSTAFAAGLCAGRLDAAALSEDERSVLAVLVGSGAIEL